MQVCRFGVPAREDALSIRIPSHMYRNRHGTYYFRLAVPLALRHLAGKSEVRFSLGTEQRHQAIHCALPLIADLPRLLETLQCMADNNETPPLDYFKLWQEGMFKASSLEWKVRDLKRQLEDQAERMTVMVPRRKAKQVGKIMHERGQLMGMQEMEKHLASPWFPEKTKLFSELQVAWLTSFSNRAKGGNRKPLGAKSLEGYKKDTGFFIEVMGDVRIGLIDRDSVGAYFSILRKLPANLSRVSKYRGKTIRRAKCQQQYSPVVRASLNPGPHCSILGQMAKIVLIWPKLRTSVQTT